jgi:hypothetical protein
MLVQERTEAPTTVESKTTLHLLAGLPAEWIGKVGEVVSAERTPTTLGTVVSLKLTRISATTFRLELDPGLRATETYVHVPLVERSQIAEAKMDGRAIPTSAIKVSASGRQAVVSVGALAHPVTLDFTLGAIMGHAR